MLNEGLDMVLEHPNLKAGQKLTNKMLMEIFKCGERGGMRRSLSTNTLVLISHTGVAEYEDLWQDDNEIWHFQGMGLKGDQSLDYLQNKTLAHSNENRVNLHLFYREKKSRGYIYVGRVLLAGTPYFQEDTLGYRKRKVIIFPLIEVGKEVDTTEFLSKFPEEELINRGIIDKREKTFSEKSVKNFITLLKENNVDTLKSEGWYLNKKGIFYNQHSLGIKGGNINVLVKKNLINKYDVLRDQDKYINPYYESSLVFKFNFDKTQQDSNAKTGKHLSGLRIQALTFKNDLIKDTIIFGEFNRNNSNEIYSSIMIGPNGTGKSLILSFVQRIFTDLYLLRVSKKPHISSETNYELTYLLNNNTYSVKQENGRMSFSLNGTTINMKELVLPEKVISCAFTIQDRFTMLRDDEQSVSQYEYLGLRKYVKRNHIEQLSGIVASNIMQASLTNKNLLSNLKNMTTFLDFNPLIRIIFEVNDYTIDDLLNPQVIESRQEEMHKELPKIEMIFAEDIVHLINRLMGIQLRSIFNDEESTTNTFYLTEDKVIITLDLDSPGKYENLYDTFKGIWHLVDLKLMKSPNIKMKKSNKWFYIDEASSGEFQYLSTIINILSKVKPNSLILIDEPETSLHPTWQYKYMTQLCEIFKEYYSSHFLIATHSHFIVSDLKPENSSIVTLTPKDNDVNIKILNEKTFGRSAEDILYNVFNMPTTRNHYLGNDLDIVLEAITFGEIDNTIREKVMKLREVQTYLKDADPLKLLILKIIEKVGPNV